MTPGQRKTVQAALEALLQAPVTARKLEPTRTDQVESGYDDDEQPLAEMLQAIASNRNRNDELVRGKARAALKRLRDDPEDFGLCADCEEEIPLKRLQAMPWAERCVGCQAKFEPKARATRRKLTE